MKKAIKFLKSTILISILLLSTFIQANATHMMGADVSWKCKGNDTFIVTITLYRDCNGIPLSPNTLYLSPIGCSGSEKEINSSLSKGKDITPVCSKSCTRCTDPSCSFQFGIEQYEQVQTVVFKNGDCCKWELKWGECCRNGAITTITPNDFWIRATIDRCQTPCDNSPYFTNPPMAIICTNQCFVLNQGVNDIDVDGRGNADSLSYHLTNPLGDSSGNPVSWNSPYNYKEPLKYDGAFGNPNKGPWDPAHKKCKGFHLDSITGDLEFKPIKSDVTVLSILVDEWKKDSLGNPYKAATVRRDVQISVIDCPTNHVPIISGINGGNSNDIDYCVGENKCFKINSFDIDKDDTVTLSWNNAIPGATFNVPNKSTKRPTGTFCWKPTQARTYPYYFVVNAKDNSCPVNGRSNKSFAIHVYPRPEAIYSAVVSSCGTVTFSATGVSGAGKPGVVSYIWSGNGNPILFSTSQNFTHKYRKSGVYRYSLTIKSAKGCSYTYNDSVVISPYVFISLPTNDTTVCNNTTLNITTTSYGGSKPYSYTWNCSKSTNDTINYTFVIPKGFKDSVYDTSVVVNIKDQTGCTNYDSMKVHIRVPPIPILPKDTFVCYGSPISIDDHLGSNLKHNWDKKINNKWVAISNGNPFYTIDSGYYRVTVTNKKIVNCDGVSNTHIHINNPIIIDTNSINTCFNSPISLIGGIADSPSTSWTWKDLTHNKIVSHNRVFHTTAKNNIVYEITALQIENGVTCIKIGQKTLLVSPNPIVTIGKIPNMCINDAPLNLSYYVTQNPSIGYRNWSVGGQNIVGDIINPSSFGPGKFELICKFTTPIGCIAIDSTQINIDSTPHIIVPKSQTICSNDSLYQLVGSPTGGKWTGPHVKPNKNGSYYFYPSEADQGVYWLVYKYMSLKTKCSAIDSFQVTVLQEKVININQPSAICINSTPEILQASPTGGSWVSNDASEALVLISGNIGFDPTKLKNYSGVSQRYNLKYTYSYPGGYCPISDSTTIIVNPIPIVNARNNSLNYCSNGPIVKLKGTPIGGNWFGDGINGGWFDPSKTSLGYHTLTYIYNDKNGCSNYDSIIINIQNAPTDSIIPVPILCNGDKGNLLSIVSNSGGVTWRRIDGSTPTGISDTNANPTSYTPTISDISNGYVDIISLTKIDKNNSNCDQATSKIHIKMSPSPMVHPWVYKNSGCSPLSISFRDSSQNVSIYNWYFGDGEELLNSKINNPTHIYRNAGTYKVKMIGISSTGCLDSSSKINIIAYSSPIPIPYANPYRTMMSLPIVKFEGDMSYNLDESKFLWNFGDGSKSSILNPTHTYSDTGVYKVNLFIKNKTGCFGDSTIDIIIAPDMLVYIPDAFTPNQSGPIKNEIFTPSLIYYQSYNMKIYNRWGELLYETNSIDRGWDGKFKGQYCQDDAYVYVIKVISFSGREYTYTGTVTLLK